MGENDEEESDGEERYEQQEVPHLASKRLCMTRNAPIRHD